MIAFLLLFIGIFLIVQSNKTYPARYQQREADKYDSAIEEKKRELAALQQKIDNEPHVGTNIEAYQKLRDELDELRNRPPERQLILVAESYRKSRSV